MTRMAAFLGMARRRALPGVVAVCAMIGCAQVVSSAAGFDSAKSRDAQGTGFVAKATAPSSSKSSTSSKAAGSKKSSRKHHARSRREPTQKAPTPDRIREIQSALASEGYYPDEPNGKWDGRTVEAMEKFQQEHGLSASGKLDALSLQKLGLGSQIAGVSAPQPPMVSSPDSTAPASPKSPEP